MTIQAVVHDGVVQRHEDRGQRLLDVVMATAADVEQPEVLRRIVRAAADLLDVRCAAIGVYGSDRTRLADLVHAGMDQKTVERIRGGGFPPKAGGTFSVPIRVGRARFGELYVSHKRPGEDFTAEDEQTVRTLATATGMAVRNIRLHEQSRWRDAWLQASNEINAALLASAPGTNELQLVTARARMVAGAPVAALALPDRRDESKLVFEVVDGFGPVGNQLIGVTIDLATTASGVVFHSRKPMLIDSYGDGAAAWHGEDSPLHDVLLGLGSAAIVPLTAGEHPLGVLLLARRRGDRLFDQADLGLLENFAAHAALALQYARAQADQRRLALVEERDRIGGQLHDLIIQRLFATGMALQSAANMVPVNPPEATMRIRRAVDDLDETIRQIRTTVFSLKEPDAS